MSSRSLLLQHHQIRHRSAFRSVRARPVNSTDQHLVRSSPLAAAIGGAVGGVVCVVATTLAVLYCRKRNHRRIDRMTSLIHTQTTSPQVLFPNSKSYHSRTLSRLTQGVCRMVRSPVTSDPPLEPRGHHQYRKPPMRPQVLSTLISPSDRL